MPAGDIDAALVVELVRLTRHTPEPNPQSRDTKVVILAGGRGRRLEPFASILPKPLMPIGNHSIIEIIVNQLVNAGFRNLTFSVGYLSHLIRAVFESTLDAHPNGSLVRADITWVQESQPLGTAAPLRLVEGLESTFLAMNGDLLTTLDFAAFLEHHRDSGNAITIAAQRRNVRMNYGVLHLKDDACVDSFEEKPETILNVSMGIYAVEPQVLSKIPSAGPFDFPELVTALLNDNIPIGVFVHDGLWFDIGRHEDYENAVALWERGLRLDRDEEDRLENPDSLGVS